MKLNIAIVHGIGVNTQGYAEPLIKGISRQFNKQLRRILKSSGNYSDELNFIPIVWDDIVAYEQARLDDIFRQEFDRRREKSLFVALWQFIVCLELAFILYKMFNNAFFFLIIFFPVLYFAPKTLYWLRTSFAAEFVCDITSYNEQGSKDLILQRIKDSIQPIIKPLEAQNLTFISHSLGTVIASDFVREEGVF